MKRKWVCVIDGESDDELEDSSNKSKMPSEAATPSPSGPWLKRLQDSKKTCTSANGLRRVKYLMEDGSEMFEEYSLNTSCLTRRAWRKAETPLGGPPDWTVEIGEAPPKLKESEDFRESNDQPIITKRNTRNNLEWRIRNLPYPIDVYSVAANPTENCIIIKTTNKKYYKKLTVPDLERIGFSPKQANIEYTHKFNTLIITYKKPQELKDFEKFWYEELNKIETTDSNPIDECKTS